MIKKLRARIILINMTLMGIVILSIFAAVCVNAYSNAANELERGLNQVVDIKRTSPTSTTGSRCRSPLTSL